MKARISAEGGEGASISSFWLSAYLPAKLTNTHGGAAASRARFAEENLIEGSQWISQLVSLDIFPLERIPSSIHAFIRSFIKHYQALTKHQVLF